MNDKLDKFTTHQLQTALDVLRVSDRASNAEIEREIEQRKHATHAARLRDIYYANHFDVQGNDGFIRLAKHISANYIPKGGHIQ